MKNERWKPEKGDLYFFVSTVGEVFPDRADSDFASFNGRFGFGNYFRSRSEAQAAAEKVKALLLSIQDNGGNLPDNGNNLASNLPDKELPKLTAEVFDRPDCPEWAKYAAVDAAGLAYWYQYFPVTDERIGVWKVWKNKRQLIDGFFDRSDWQNSLIERPTELPKWVEIGGYVYDDRNSYGKIVSGSVKSCYIEFDGGAGDFVPEAFRDFKQARLRPYNAEEMKALVGKPITMLDGAVCLCTVYSKRDESVILESIHWDAQELLRSGYTLNGKPCGVLEHLNENGEWVE